jgi:hypothetical protein
MFADIGVLPNSLNLWRPQGSGHFSLLNAFSTSGELWVLWAVILATYVCLFIGFKTKVMQVLSLVFVTSMNGRVLLIENGGYVVQNLLLMWTCFLPMGDRFSVDALRASMQRSRERTAADLNDRTGLDDPQKPNDYVTILGLVLLIQVSAIYFFNVVHKTGPAWKNGTAVHFVLYVDRMVTPGVAAIRDYVPNWMILFMTKTAIAFEEAIPVCLLCNLARPWARRCAMFMMNALHLAFGTTFVLGPFAWALCVWSTLLLGRDDWEIAARAMRRTHRARTVLFDPSSPGALFVCRILKRMDRFELLTFAASSDATYGLAVAPAPGASGSMSTLGAPGRAPSARGADALADILAALPLGPAVAWVFRLPGVKQATTALMAAMSSGNTGAALGIQVPATAGIAPPVSPLVLSSRSALALLRELGVATMFVGAVSQAGNELWTIKNRWKVPQPEPVRLLSHKLRFLQGWFMFSPNPVMDDGTIVVDALTIDGRHIDPFTGNAPDFDILDAKSYGYTQIWCDYFNRMHLPQNTSYREAMKDYIYRYPERTGRPEDTIVSGEVYWIKDWNPKWNTVQSYGQEREKMFTFQNPKVKAPEPAAPTLPAEAPPSKPAVAEPAN